MKQQVEIKSCAERRWQLEAATRAHRERGERELAALKRQGDAVNARVQTQITEAEQRAARFDERLAAVIAVDVQSALAPLVTAWLAEPSRKIAVAIADVYRASDSRLQRELGLELWSGVLAVAFASELVKTAPGSADAFGADWSPAVVELLGAFRQSLSFGPSQVEAAIKGLESELHAAASRSAGTAGDSNVKRLDVKRSCVSHSDAARKLSAFDAREAEEHQAAFAASYTPPEPLHHRALRMLGM